MVDATHQLPELLKQMVDDIQDPQCYYWVYSSYFDILPPTDRTITRWQHTQLFLDYDRNGGPAL